MLPEDDVTRLRHMLDAAEEALGFAQGKSRADLDSDRMFARAVIQDIEIVGEAACRVTQDTQETYPHIPWAAIIAMRNRLIHAYFSVDLDRVWDTLVDDLPVLVRALRRVLDEESALDSP
jgi:uncharacterized protein with HEPN domain